MDDLKKQIDILIYNAESRKAEHLIHFLDKEVYELTGQIDAFKLIKLLINTNLKITEQ